MALKLQGTMILSAQEPAAIPAAFKLPVSRLTPHTPTAPFLGHLSPENLLLSLSTLLARPQISHPSNWLLCKTLNPNLALSEYAFPSF